PQVERGSDWERGAPGSKRTSERLPCGRAVAGHNRLLCHTRMLPREPVPPSGPSGRHGGPRLGCCSVIELRTPAEIEQMRPAGDFVARVLDATRDAADVGVNLL